MRGLGFGVALWLGASLSVHVPLRAPPRRGSVTVELRLCGSLSPGVHADERCVPGCCHTAATAAAIKMPRRVRPGVATVWHRDGGRSESLTGSGPCHWQPQCSRSRSRSRRRRVSQPDPEVSSCFYPQVTSLPVSYLEGLASPVDYSQFQLLAEGGTAA
jgi:hypothetical protein